MIINIQISNTFLTSNYRFGEQEANLYELKCLNQNTKKLNKIITWNLELHQSKILSLKFKFEINQGNLISGNSKGVIKFHDQNFKQKDKDNCSSGNYIAFSASSQLLATCGKEQVIQLWDVKQGKLSKSLRLNKLEIISIQQILFSFDEQTLACNFKNNIKLWNHKTGQLQEINHKNKINHLDFSPQEQILAFGCNDGSIVFQDIQKNIQVNQIMAQKQEIIRIRYSPCGKLLASCGYEGTIYFWDTESGELKKSLKGNSAFVSSIAFSSDGRILVSQNFYNNPFLNATIALWDINEEILIQVTRIEQDDEWDIKFSPNGYLIATGIQIWNIFNFQNSDFLQLLIEDSYSNSSTLSVDFSPDGTMFASGNSDHSILIWQIEMERDIYKTYQFGSKDCNQKFIQKITPLYAFTKNFTLIANESTMKNSIITSSLGMNLTPLFKQLRGWIQ